jgi:hypothetical protein
MIVYKEKITIKGGREVAWPLFHRPQRHTPAVLIFSVTQYLRGHTKLERRRCLTRRSRAATLIAMKMPPKQASAP